MPNNKQKNVKGRGMGSSGVNRSSRRAQQQPIFPPKIIQTRKLTQLVRYNAQSLTKAVVTRRCLLNMKLVGTVASTVFTLASAFTSVKMKRVRIWSNTPDASVDIAFCWLGPNSSQTIQTDTGNQNRPAKIQTFPEKFSQSGYWFSTLDTDLDTPLMQFSCTNNVTIDILISYVAQDWTCMPYAGIKPVSSPATGLYYYTPPLDNVTTGNVPGPGLIMPVYLDGTAGD